MGDGGEGQSQRWKLMAVNQYVNALLVLYYGEHGEDIGEGLDGE